MAPRLTKILLALWWLIWSCIIVPAHTRGAIAVDGTLARDAQGRTVSFFFSGLPSCCQPKNIPGQKPAPASSANCAICMIVAHTGISVHVPPVVDAPRQSHLLFLPRSAQIATIPCLPAYHGRAPPLPALFL